MVVLHKFRLKYEMKFGRLKQHFKNVRLVLPTYRSINFEIYYCTPPLSFYNYNIQHGLIELEKKTIVNNIEATKLNKNEKCYRNV